MEKFNSLFSQYKLPIILSLVGVVLIVGGIFSSNLLSAKAVKYSKTTIANTSGSSEIKVDISGAVNNPGVVSLASNSRIEDAISKAGGLSLDVNQDYVEKSLNLSQKLVDGQKIYIPNKSDQTAFSGQTITSVAGVSGQLVGINSGSENDLENLPGIGPATASKIISSRPYSDLNDLVAKKAVSKGIFEKIKNLIDLR
ncbi:helix-hairpin-helix domain-containing protein [Candidatus Daviesbacteria bacterium]|nr:helix-hairpin-helix domain-containing protein [Candidatus Daviesbacteria bacterium]